jgi:hypothetical protein
VETTPQTKIDIMILPIEGDGASGWKPGKPRVFLNGPHVEAEPMFSPDGRWLAYSAGESGHPEVYVRAFPGPGGPWQISTGGGVNPTWSRTKPELFYGFFDGRIMVADYSVTGDAFHAGTPRPWSEGRYQPRGPGRMFDLHPDGKRFAVAPAAETPGGDKQDKVVFVFNFFDELRRLVPAPKR